MNIRLGFPLVALALLLIILPILLQGCASPQPVAVACPEMPGVPAFLMGPAKNAYLTVPSLKEPRLTP